MIPQLLIGNSVILECISDGNPNPNYTWKFNHSNIGQNTKFNISADKSMLSFTVTNFSDSGLYQCVAYNYIKGNLFNSSSNVTITVRERHEEEYSLEMEKKCLENSCLLIQNCILRNGRAFCSVNIWIVIAVVFISLSLILGTTTMSLIFARRTQKKNTVSITEEVDMGYVSYEDNSLFLSPAKATISCGEIEGIRCISCCRRGQ